MQRSLSLLWLVMAAFMASCSSEADERGREIAKVKDKVLYESEVKGLLPARCSPEDSANIISRYVNSWIRKELLFLEASQNSSMDQAELDKMLEEYKFQLLVFDFNKKFIEKNLDTVVTPEQIEKYYQDNQDNFLLKHGIVQAYLIKADPEAPKKEELKRWLRNLKPENLEEIQSWCSSYAADYSVDDSLWVSTNEISNNTPFDLSDTRLQKGKFIEEQDSAFIYYIRINDYKTTAEPAPLNFVRDQIDNMILNQRKMDLLKKLEDDIYQKAKGSNSFEILGK